MVQAILNPVAHTAALSVPRDDREAIRRAYLAFRFGVELNDNDVQELVAQVGLHVSMSQVRAFGRRPRSHGGGAPISAIHLWGLISAWHAEHEQPEPAPREPKPR